MNQLPRVNELIPAEPVEQRDGPSLFTGIGFVFDEIVVAQTACNAKVHEMRAAMVSRHEAAMKQAADELSKLANQAAILSATISNVISKHQRRIAKIRE